MLQNLNMKSFFKEQQECRESVNSFIFYVPASPNKNYYSGGDQSVLEKPKPDLHKGEIIITGGPRVLLFPNVSERTKGLTGSIFVTNFRLIFDTYEDNRTPEEECLHQRNFLFGEYSVCLTNIDSIYQISGDKKRRLLPDSPLAAKIKGLQLVCKNMKVLTFSFDQSPINLGKDVTKTLLHHAFPGKHELLFGYDYREDKPSTDKYLRDVVLFSQRHDWENELARTCSKSASKWRLSSQNQTFQLSSSLPKWLIIPNSVVDCDLATASYSFRCNRPPVWTWSSPNGAALVRMADLLPTVTDRTQENRMLENIRKCHPHLKGPSIKYLDKDLPSIRDLLQSYSKLRELCIPDSQREFKGQDSHFYSRLESTKWLQHVSSCLRISVKAAREVQEGTTVVLQESEGRDTSAIVSSLVQLILDPHTRSIAGFQSLYPEGVDRPRSSVLQASGALEER
ncbi:UNVERIFIED_CONTAM: hypothetical protein PYX00_008071 [Menopon gallinae]|uniref:Myotubularin phosphatase domain-containing protein n=1 Tax=Menopon gallinae TaxID=328185 RepID=A0AAW2HMV9_9NEOP